MAKSQEELIVIKKEFETLNIKLKELNDDELKEVTGGTSIGWDWLYGSTIDDYQSDTRLGNR